MIAFLILFGKNIDNIRRIRNYFNEEQLFQDAKFIEEDPLDDKK